MKWYNHTLMLSFNMFFQGELKQVRRLNPLSTYKCLCLDLFKVMFDPFYYEFITNYSLPFGIIYLEHVPINLNKSKKI